MSKAHIIYANRLGTKVMVFKNQKLFTNKIYFCSASRLGTKALIFNKIKKLKIQEKFSHL